MRKKKIFEFNNFHKVFVQPNMVFSVQPKWLNIDDYTTSLTKKYRDRYKRSRKKNKETKVVELSLEDIKNKATVLHDLYKNVSNNAKFNTFLLPKNHFYSLKFHLKENFKVYGYFLDNELIGFYTLILNNRTLETYFLGYNSEYQSLYQLYLNMLYDMVAFAIDNNYKTIVYARTAMAIKSSVGAEAKDMAVYLKHTQPFFNIILKQVFKFMNPSQNWKARHPFK